MRRKWRGCRRSGRPMFQSGGGHVVEGGVVGAAGAVLADLQAADRRGYEVRRGTCQCRHRRAVQLDGGRSRRPVDLRVELEGARRGRVLRRGTVKRRPNPRTFSGRSTLGGRTRRVKAGRHISQYASGLSPGAVAVRRRPSAPQSALPSITQCRAWSSSSPRATLSRAAWIAEICVTTSMQ